MRESNIELLRIVCMLMIIAHHSIVHGGILTIDNCFNKYVALLLVPGGKMMFVTFIVISAWFLVDKKFNLERFIKTWLQVLFYSVLFAIVASNFEIELNWHNWLGSFFPIIGNSHGFAATYLAFYLLIPILAILDKNMTKTQHLYLGGVLLYVEVVSLFAKGIFFNQVVILSSELTLFIFIYFLTSYIKKYEPFNIHNSSKFFVMLFIIWLMIFGIFLLNTSDYRSHWYISLLMYLCNDESSLLYIIGGYCAFFCFLNIKIS